MPFLGDTESLNGAVCLVPGKGRDVNKLSIGEDGIGVGVRVLLGVWALVGVGVRIEGSGRLGLGAEVG